MNLKNFIGGTFREPLTRRSIDNINPYTVQVINTVPASGVEDVRRAIAAASEAFPSWSKVSVQERAAYLRRIADEIEKNSAEFALAESRDTGKPLTLATNVDIDRGIHNFRFFADVLLAQQEECFEQEAPQRAVHHIVRRPVGVAALISPWNLPLYLLSWKVLRCIPVLCYDPTWPGLT
jgi:aminomuconate-semialdehyde/2-hydroxymuconate-6-semialdehyde dehydrogenase